MLLFLVIIDATVSERALIDCTDLKMFDTAGFAYVTAYQKKMKDRGGEIKMINVGNDYVKEMFRTIEMSKFFSIEEI